MNQDNGVAWDAKARSRWLGKTVVVYGDSPEV